MKAKRFWVSVVAVTALFCLMSASMTQAAEQWPRKPVTFVVAYPPGGTTDMVARMFAQVFSKVVGQPANVVNKAGAGTTLGTLEVMNSAPDGSTLGFFANALLSAQYTLPEPVDFKSVQPMAMVSFDPATLGVAEQTGFKSLKDLIDFARKNPKKLRLAYEPGTATTHLYLLEFLRVAKIDASLVPFKGGGETKTALAGGHIDACFNPYSVFAPLVQAGNVRVIAVASDKRQSFYKDIPTLKEQGIDMAFGTWHGVFAPPKTPKDIVSAIESATEKTVNSKEFVEIMTKNAIPLDYRNQAAFNKFLANEDRVYREAATEAGLYKPKK